MPVTLDPAMMQFGIDPNVPSVNVTQKQVKLRDGLKAVLAPHNLRFGLVKEGVFISTEDGVTARQLRQRVTIDCDGSALANCVKQLAADTGANLVLDPRLKDRASAPVTLKLEDVPLETTVRLLAEVADLRAVRMSNVLFVTTPERARSCGRMRTARFRQRGPLRSSTIIILGRRRSASLAESFRSPRRCRRYPRRRRRSKRRPKERRSPRRRRPQAPVDRNRFRRHEFDRVTRASARPSLGLRQTAPLRRAYRTGN